ncbi:MAG: SpoIID/LytB domain-containing protein [Candidatus Gastranaerophilales bacterium]|nr:SpoIID/LytB domain-containing protein [Candidatus Gastranaerophilales bacterium]
MKKFFIILSILLLSAYAHPALAIKIGLYTNESSVMVSASEEAQMIDIKTNKQVCIVRKMLMYEITPLDKDSMIVRSNYGQCTIYTKDVVLKPINQQACVYTKNKWYRGILRIQNKDNTLTVINDVCMENYIQGVLAAEMPSSWGKEALKAQAIAARTYAVANYGKHSSEGFDLVDTQMDQVYNGIQAETEASNIAVRETDGIIMTYNKKPITAMYSSSAGGQTHSALESWGNDIPYLQSVPSYDDDVKSFGHGVGMTQHGAKNLAKMGNNAYQILSHFYNNIQFARLNPIYYK